MRCAIYFVPPRGDNLCSAAASWLRRDPYTGAGVAVDVPGLSQQEHALITAVPRRYGFHGTIKAPFQLAEGCTLDLLGNRLDAFLKQSLPFEFEMEITQFDSSYVFAPRRAVAPLTELAAQVVAEFDHFRIQLSDEQIEKRNVSQLNERQLSHLVSWGYPYVFDQFRFHMTLTGPVAPRERPAVERALRAHFGERPRRVSVSQLVVAVEPTEPAPFLIYSVHPFAAVAALLTA